MKSICLYILLLGLGSNSYAQKPIAYRLPASEKVIPLKVKQNFREAYPYVLLKGWYATHISYWQNDVSAGWYSEWYGQRTIVVYTFEKPTYYEVEFIDQPGELSRAIYNLHGYWYETRTLINGLPMALYDALKDNGYGDWEVSKLKEMMVTASWPEEIYRFQISKGARDRIIRMDVKGNIIQEKYIDD